MRHEDSMLDDLIRAPWWVSALIAAVVFIGLRFVLPAIATQPPVIQPAIQILSQLAWLFSGTFVVISLVSAATKLSSRFHQDRDENGRSGEIPRFSRSQNSPANSATSTFHPTPMSAIEGGSDNEQLHEADNEQLPECSSPFEPDLDQPFPYRKKSFLFSAAERSFHGVLLQAIGDDYLIFAKTRLADLLFLPGGIQNRQAWFNKIQAKHVDFLICSRSQVEPLLVIELDDSSHAQPERQSRDGFVDHALSCAELPVLRFPVKRTYLTREIREVIAQYIEL